MIVEVSIVLRKTVGGSWLTFQGSSSAAVILLTLKMTTAEAVEMSVTTTNRLSQDYTNLDDHNIYRFIIYILVNH